jgi:hypothetical protein
MVRVTARIGAAAIVLFAAAAPREARADDSDRVSAEVLFQEGRKLVAAGKYAEGCAKLEASQRLDPGTGTLFNLADCEERRGRIATAWAMFLEAAAGARAAGNGAREQAARERAAAVERKLPRLVIKVRSTAPSVTVKRDGVVVDRALWGTAVPVDPGTRVIEVSAPGRTTWKASVEVPATPASVEVETPELAQESSTPAPVEPGTRNDSDVTPHSGGSRVVVAGTLLGLGAAGVTVGAIFGLSARSKWDEAKTYCVVGNQCWQTGLDLADDARRSATVSTIAFVGGALALAGGTILLVSRPSGRSSAARVELGVIAAASQGQIRVSGSF